MSTSKKIIIIGAGFAGLHLARKLRNSEYDITIIDKNNYHTFIPLLYQVATGGLEVGSVAFPLRRTFRKSKNIHFQMAEVEKVDLSTQEVATSVGVLQYDYLVLCTGSKVNFFDFDADHDQLLTLKSVQDALRIRASIMQRLEKAVANATQEDLERLLNIAIIGGGPTGLEMAGVLAEMRDYVLPKDFPALDFSKMSIRLYEMAPELLGSMSDKASKDSLRYLQDMGVEVYLDTRVESFDGQQLQLGDGSKFPTQTVVWAAGVQGATIKGIPNELIQEQNRLLVDEHCRLKGYQNVFAIGDVAAHPTQEHPRGLPMLAPVAIQQGQYLGRYLRRISQEKVLEPFHYFNKGSMATIGRSKAVADLPFMSFSGFVAWMAWLFIHLFYLLGVRSKVMTLLGWFNNYVSYDRPLGLILWPDRKEEQTQPAEVPAE